ncbi:MarR family winged helix-turn-helix transcriptional regulator [Gluconacetobacter tumulicola]|uniref:MarR family transcriptional regulator n=1 Tax=Gluconacetobacter tumulicola TaxID=1017177 RepID=A0A7W4P677_9PROT|nr:MarR family transcriptional regulator [Gluconacetobacter tumulicola]MBB2178664.1 MarR family transcriptional regulator [Gluconacetobacter tumulicola]
MTKNLDKPELDAFICFSLYAASHAFNRLYQPLLEPLGLTYPQYLVMSVLWAGDGKLVGEIGARLGLVSSTLTPLLKRLENSGLVARSRDREDERQVRVTLTPEGRTLRAQAATVPGCVLTATGMTTDELGDLRAKIDTLRVAIEGAVANR